MVSIIHCIRPQDPSSFCGEHSVQNIFYWNVFLISFPLVLVNAHTHVSFPSFIVPVICCTFSVSSFSLFLFLFSVIFITQSIWKRNFRFCSDLLCFSVFGETSPRKKSGWGGIGVEKIQPFLLVFIFESILAFILRSYVRGVQFEVVCYNDVNIRFFMHHKTNSCSHKHINKSI